MKKSLISMAAVLFTALMTTTMLTSCSSNDDVDEPKKAEFTKAVVKYTVESNVATLGLFKVNVYGTDADGKDFIETMSNSNPTYIKTVEIPVSKLPCSVELYTMVSPLEGKAATEKFDFRVKWTLDVMTVNSDDTVVSNLVRVNTLGRLNCGPETSLSELAETMNDYSKLIMYIDAKGKITATTTSDF